MSTKDNLHVMVVDDMSTSRGLITQALDWMQIKKYDYSADGQTALAKISKAPVHLVISDYNMPGMDGLQLLHALRTNKMTERIGFILITGSVDPKIIDEGRRLQMNNFLKKPFSPNALKTCIQQVVGPL
ncbi:response regulator [Rhodobacterales bacterium HKCCE4037]|nr:response regulator [Rhodobacterales bacterium HKCCE4037]